MLCFSFYLCFNLFAKSFIQTFILTLNHQDEQNFHKSKIICLFNVVEIILKSNLYPACYARLQTMQQPQLRLLSSVHQLSGFSDVRSEQLHWFVVFVNKAKYYLLANTTHLDNNLKVFHLIGFTLWRQSGELGDLSKDEHLEIKTLDISRSWVNMDNFENLDQWLNWNKLKLKYWGNLDLDWIINQSWWKSKTLLQPFLTPKLSKIVSKSTKKSIQFL